MTSFLDLLRQSKQGGIQPGGTAPPADPNGMGAFQRVLSTTGTQPSRYQTTLGDVEAQRMRLAQNGNVPVVGRQAILKDSQQPQPAPPPNPSTGSTPVGSVANTAGQGAGLLAANSLLGGGGEVATTTASPMVGGITGSSGVAAVPGVSAMGAAPLYLYAAPVVGGALAMQQAKKIPQDWAMSDTKSGAKHGALAGFFGGVDPFTAALLGAGGTFGSGKDKAQMMRDSVRSNLQKAGVVGGDWNLSFSDGSKFDIGKDGNAKFTGFDGKTVVPYYNHDPSNPLSEQARNALLPLTDLITRGDPALTSQFNAYFSNAITQGTNDPKVMMKRLGELYQKFGLTKEQAVQGIQDLAKGGKIDSQRAGVLANTVNSLPISSDAGGGASFTMPSFDTRALASANAASRKMAKENMLVQAAQSNQASTANILASRPSGGQNALVNLSAQAAQKGFGNGGAGLQQFDQALQSILLK